MKNKEEITKKNKIIDYTKLHFYSPSSSGLFYTYANNRPMLYFSCRESFSRRFLARSKQFGFFVKNLTNIKSVLSALEWAESELKLNKVSRNKFEIAKASCGYMLIVTPSSWWKRNLLRRQVLTAIMRAGLSEYEHPADRMKNSTYFCSETLQKALNKFLSGYTRTNLKLDFLQGWKHHFNKEENLKHLLKP